MYKTLAAKKELDKILKNPLYAAIFASRVKNINIEQFREAVCKDTYAAYVFARDVDINNASLYEKIVCKNPYHACIFARDVTGANIEYCQEQACKNPYYAVQFIKLVKQANLDYCQEQACKDSIAAYLFARNIKGADLDKCKEAALKTPAGACWWGRKVARTLEEINECKKIALAKPGIAFEYIMRGEKTFFEECVKSIYKSPKYSYLYALFFHSKADIKKCEKIACQDPLYAVEFAKNIRGANIEYCKKYAKRSKVYAKIINEFIMRKACE